MENLSEKEEKNKKSVSMMNLIARPYGVMENNR